MITDKEIDEICLLPRLDFPNLIAKYGYDAKNDRYIPLVVQAPTGSGKTMRMLQVVKDLTTSGVVFCHSIEAIRELVNKLRDKNLFNYTRDDILEFHSENQPLYREYVNNPENLKNYRWIFAYNERLFSGQLKYYTSRSEVNYLIDNNDLVAFINGSTYSKYIFIDECMSKPIEVDYTESEVNEFLRILDNQDELNPSSIQDLLNDKDDPIKSRANFNLLNLLWKLTYGKLKSNYVECNGYDEADEYLLKNQLFIKLVHILIKDKYTKLDYRPSILFEILEARGYNFIKNIYRNLNKISLDFSNILKRSWETKIGIQDLPDRYPIIAFDATAEVNYKDSDFKIITVKDLIKGYHEHENLIKVNILPYNFLTRESDNPDILKEWKSHLPEFKDDSIILWTMDLGKNKNLDAESLILERCKGLGLKNCHFIYYGSGEIKGTNKFNDCKHIYVLSEYLVNQNHVKEHRESTGSTTYTTQDKCIGDIVQLIGRSHIRYTRIIPCDKLTDDDQVEVYFVNNINPYVINEVTKLVKGKYNLEDEYTLRWYISNFLTDINGNKIKSNVSDKVINFMVNSGIKFIDEVTLEVGRHWFGNDSMEFKSKHLNAYKYYLNQLM